MRLAHAVFRPSFHIEPVRNPKDTQTCFASQSFNTDPKETTRTCLGHYIHWLAMTHNPRRQRELHTTPFSLQTHNTASSIENNSTAFAPRDFLLYRHMKMSMFASRFHLIPICWVYCFFPSSKLRVTLSYVTPTTLCSQTHTFQPQQNEDSHNR